jgi:hypothetical protein
LLSPTIRADFELGETYPVSDSQVKEFDGVDDAKMFAAVSKNNFDRVVLMQEDNERARVT